MLTFSASNPWATLSSSGTSGKDLSPTAELDPLLSHLSTTLAFLFRVLAPAPLRRVTRTVLAAVNAEIWGSALQRTFSTPGAAQLNADLEAICAVVDEKVGAGVAENGLRKCLEGAKLVGLPAKGSRTSTNAPQLNDGGEDEGMEEWDAWAADDADAGDESSKQVSQKATSTRDAAEAGEGVEDLGLWEVERRLFADNQSARDVLEELGLDVLDEKEARRLLRLRVELAG